MVIAVVMSGCNTIADMVGGLCPPHLAVVHCAAVAVRAKSELAERERIARGEVPS